MTDYSSLSREELERLADEQSRTISEQKEIISNLEIKVSEKEEIISDLEIKVSESEENLSEKEQRANIIKKAEAGRDNLLLELSSYLDNPKEITDNLLRCAVMGIKNISESFNGRFYKLIKIDEDTRKKIIKKEEFKDYNLDIAWYMIFDTRQDPKNFREIDRYLAILPNNTTGEAFFRGIPIVATPKIPDEDERLPSMMYSDKLGVGRFYPFKANRAAFPIKDKRSIEYVLVIDKESPFSNYELRFVRDVTNMVSIHLPYKRLQQSLRELKHNLVSSFVGVNGFIRRLGDYLANPDLNNVRAKMINSNKTIAHLVGYMQDLISGVIDSNAQEKTSPFCIGELLKQTFTDSEDNKLNILKESICPEKTVIYQFDVGRSDVLINGNRSEFESVLDNMVKNSLEGKCIGDLGIYVSSWIEKDVSGKIKQYFFYSDNAGGMDPNLVKSVWESKENSTTKEKGQGLGVNFIKEYFIKNGWTIALQNDPGYGCGYLASRTAE